MSLDTDMHIYHFATLEALHAYVYIQYLDNYMYCIAILKE